MELLNNNILYRLALDSIRGHECALCLQRDLTIKKFTPINEWEAEVIYACSNPECDKEYKDTIIDDN